MSILVKIAPKIAAALRALLALALVATASAAPYSPEQLERLVGPMALYPDDLLAIVLPASTVPLQIVQADRFVDKRKKDPTAKPDERWHDAVRALVNYPEVVKKMSGDLEWTEQLGAAVANQKQDVLDAIQRFRRKAITAGNLKTNDKQVVVVEKEVIQIVPANPQVIYVPQYQPSVVIVAQPAPAVVYYPTAYPVYYAPPPPGAAYAAGLATAYAINWARADIYSDNIEHFQSQRYGYAQQLQDDRQQGVQERQSQRQDAIQGGQASRQEQRQSQTQRSWSAEAQPAQRPAGQPQQRAGDRDFGGGAGGRGAPDAFGGSGSGRQASLDSQRGQASRGGAMDGDRGAGAQRGGGGRSGGGRAGGKKGRG